MKLLQKYVNNQILFLKSVEYYVCKNWNSLALEDRLTSIDKIF